jgi:serine/tyrosine/threonine adenylyltransferase
MVSPTELDANDDMVGWQFDNTYSRLPEVFFASALPARVRAPRLSILNHRLADELGLNFALVSPQSSATTIAIHMGRNSRNIVHPGDPLA